MVFETQFLDMLTWRCLWTAYTTEGWLNKAVTELPESSKFRFCNISTFLPYPFGDIYIFCLGFSEFFPNSGSYRVLVGIQKNGRVPGISSGFLYSWYRAGGRAAETARGRKYASIHNTSRAVGREARGGSIIFFPRYVLNSAVKIWMGRVPGKPAEVV